MNDFQTWMVVLGIAFLVVMLRISNAFTRAADSLKDIAWHLKAGTK